MKLLTFLRPRSTQCLRKTKTRFSDPINVDVALDVQNPFSSHLLFFTNIYIYIVTHNALFTTQRLSDLTRKWMQATFTQSPAHTHFKKCMYLFFLCRKQKRLLTLLLFSKVLEEINPKMAATCKHFAFHYDKKNAVFGINQLKFLNEWKLNI